MPYRANVRNRAEYAPVEHHMSELGTLLPSWRKRTACSLGEALERGGAEQAIGGDVAVFHFGEEFRLDPRGLRVADWLGKFRRGGHHCIKLLTDLAGHGPRPARADLARVNQVSSVLP